MRNLKWLVMMLCSLNGGCSLEKSKSTDSNAYRGVEVKVTEQDWDVAHTSNVGVDTVTKSLKSSKLDEIRKSFKSPELYSYSFPEASGFEVYYSKGYASLENTAYIHPKVFVSTSSDKGSILGYKTGEKDAAGNDLVSISVPVALVNGLVTSLPLIGGSGTSAAIQLPEKFRVKDVPALQTKVAPKNLDTLPVCPKVFRLMYQGKEYRAYSPFKNLSNCPINQFFRVVFKAPTEEMKKLLEAGSLQDEAVTLVTDLSVDFVTPRTSTDVSIDKDTFRTELKTQLSSLEVKGQTLLGENGYGVEDLQDIVVASIFNVIRASGGIPEYSVGMSRVQSALIDGFFDLPFTCQKGGICRALSKRPSIQTDISYSWVKAESLSTPIETQQVVGLGAVANASSFISKPSWSVFDYGQKPKWFRGKTISSIISECDGLDSSSYPTLPGMDPTEANYIQGYCKGMIANAKRNEGDPEQTDGYYPLGANTTVYPGAWLRIDLDEISEFTTAKTKTDKDGNVVIESEVKDLMAGDPSAQRTSCVEGQQTACQKYAMKQIQVKATNGDPIFSDATCRKGDDGCVCSKNQDGTEICLKKQYQFQSVMDFDCDPKDQYQTCPYYRTQEDVIDYEREWECQNIKVEAKEGFLCFGGCSERWELQCKKKSEKPVKALRQYLNCKEDDPLGTASRENMCRRPQYICEQWATRCSRYSVNEAFDIIHENVAPTWRPFALAKGEYPKRFEDQLFLKFVSPKGTVTDCRLDKFGRFFRGNTIFIKIPSEKNEDLPCGGALWNADNSKALYLPKVYIKNAISYSETRLCGVTEYSFITKEVPVSGGRSIVPSAYQNQTNIHIGPIANSCRAPNPTPIGSDLWFSEVPPIRVSGRVSVLGRVLESIVTGDL